MFLCEVLFQPLFSLQVSRNFALLLLRDSWLSDQNFHVIHLFYLHTFPCVFVILFNILLINLSQVLNIKFGRLVAIIIFSMRVLLESMVLNQVSVVLLLAWNIGLLV